MWTRFSRRITSKTVGSLSFSGIPSLKCRWPVRLQTNDTALAKVFNEIFCRKSKDSGDSRKVISVRFFEVSAGKKLDINGSKMHR